MEARAPAVRVAADARGSRLRPILDSEKWLGWLMIGPAILYIVLLVGFPFFLALYYSVSDITIGSRSSNFVGLKNFAGIIGTAAFKTSLKNTFIFALVSQVVVLVLAKVLALLLQKDFRGKWVVRFLILLPWVAPISLGTIGWLWILHLAMGSVITVHVWRLLPLATVILLAGLSSIPQDIHDAAAVDGAGFWRRLFQITFPLVLPIMLVALLFGVVFAFTDMIVIYVLTRGGPYDTTQVLASLAFFTGIDGGDLAGGAAIALFLFPVLAACAIFLLRVARRTEVT